MFESLPWSSPLTGMPVGALVGNPPWSSPASCPAPSVPLSSPACSPAESSPGSGVGLAEECSPDSDGSEVSLGSGVGVAVECSPTSEVSDGSGVGVEVPKMWSVNEALLSVAALTALKSAVKDANTDLVKTLLAVPGLDVNAAPGGTTALFLAELDKRDEIAALLRSAGAKELAARGIASR